MQRAKSRISLFFCYCTASKIIHDRQRLHTFPCKIPIPNGFSGFYNSIHRSHRVQFCFYRTFTFFFRKKDFDKLDKQWAKGDNVREESKSNPTAIMRFAYVIVKLSGNPSWDETQLIANQWYIGLRNDKKNADKNVLTNTAVTFLFAVRKLTVF